MKSVDQYYKVSIDTSFRQALMFRSICSLSSLNQLSHAPNKLAQHDSVHVIDQLSHVLNTTRNMSFDSSSGYSVLTFCYG